VAGLFCWAATIRAAGLALSVVAMRTAVVLPVLASVIIWHEKAAAMQLVGTAAGLAALALVLSDVAAKNRRGQSEARNPESETEIDTGPGISRAAPFWLAGLFLVEGLVMVPALVFSKGMPKAENLPFQAVIFVSAFLITTAIYYVRRERVSYETAGQGLLLGTCNLGNYLFLVLALTLLPGVVVYPVIAAAEVGLMALAGASIWKERIGVRAWVGIGLAVVALVLIQLGKPAAP
jgi:drug/metabolite transporter (DMT)-like permease